MRGKPGSDAVDDYCCIFSYLGYGFKSMSEELPRKSVSRD